MEERTWPCSEDESAEQLERPRASSPSITPAPPAWPPPSIRAAPGACLHLCSDTREGSSWLPSPPQGPSCSAHPLHPSRAPNEAPTRLVGGPLHRVLPAPSHPPGCLPGPQGSAESHLLGHISDSDIWTLAPTLVHCCVCWTKGRVTLDSDLLASDGHPAERSGPSLLCARPDTARVPFGDFTYTFHRALAYLFSIKAPPLPRMCVKGIPKAN